MQEPQHRYYLRSVGLPSHILCTNMATNVGTSTVSGPPIGTAAVSHAAASLSQDSSTPISSVIPNMENIGGRLTGIFPVSTASLAYSQNTFTNITDPNTIYRAPIPSLGRNTSNIQNVSHFNTIHEMHNPVPNTDELNVDMFHSLNIGSGYQPVQGVNRVPFHVQMPVRSYMSQGGHEVNYQPAIGSRYASYAGDSALGDGHIRSSSYNQPNNGMNYTPATSHFMGNNRPNVNYSVPNTVPRMNIANTNSIYAPRVEDVFGGGASLPGASNVNVSSTHIGLPSSRNVNPSGNNYGPLYDNGEISHRLLGEEINSHRNREETSFLSNMSPVCLNGTQEVYNVQNHGNGGYDDHNRSRYHNFGVGQSTQIIDEPRFGRQNENNINERRTSQNYIPDIPNFNNVSLGNPTINKVVNIKEVEIPTFNGKTEEYKDFKELFQAVTTDYASKMKLLLLKQHLDSKSKICIAHIDTNDPNAMEHMWHELDKIFDQSRNRANYHLANLFSATKWPQCSSRDDLVELYNHLRYHHACLCRLGRQYVMQAEGIKNFLGPALYGKSCNKITGMIARGLDFNMDTVLRIIDEHIEFERAKEVAQGQARLSGRPRTSRHDRSEKPYEHRDNHQRSKSPNYKERYGSRSSSRGTQFVKRDSSSSSKDRSVSSFRHHDRSISPKKFGVYVTNVENKAQPITSSRDRSRSKSPGPRGSRAHSPVVNRDYDKFKFRCCICREHSHSTLECKVLSSQEMVKLAKSNGLCLKCMVKGHRANVCVVDKECKSTECKSFPSHNPVLCKGLRVVS